MIEKWTDCIADPRGAWAEIEQLRVALALIDDARAKALQRVDELEAERKTLWRKTDARDGTLMTYAAIYVTRWRPEWGEPQCGFIQAVAPEDV